MTGAVTDPAVTDPAATDSAATSNGAGLRDTALAAAAGDDAALDRLVAATRGTVWRICAGLVDRDSADDLTQETYLRAVRSLPTYAGTAAPVSWLATIARRVAADEIGKRQRNRQLVVRLRAERQRTAYEPAAMVDLTDALDRLGAVAPERRDAFVLTAVAGLSYADAAETCGCPVGTIRSRVARARSDLAQSLVSETPSLGPSRRLPPPPARRRPARAVVGVAAVIVALVLAGCSSGAAGTAGGSSTGSSGQGANAGRTVTAHGLRISGGYVRQPASPDVAAAYLAIANTTGHDAELTKVSTDVTTSVMAMDESDSGGVGSMTDLSRVVIPAHGSYRFTPNHAHLMLEHPTRLVAGDRVRMTLTFAGAGRVRITLPVVAIGQGGGGSS